MSMGRGQANAVPALAASPHLQLGAGPAANALAPRAALLESQTAILGLVAESASLSTILETVANAIDRLVAPARCAILLRAREGERLLLSTFPSLPAALAVALDAAAPTSTTDIWTVESIRKPAEAAGFGGVRTTIIRGQNSSVLGTINLFYPASDVPGEDEDDVLDLLSRPAAIALELEQRAQAIRLADERFTSLTASIPGVVYQRRVTPDGDIRYTYISEGVRDLFGVAPEQVLADPTALFARHDPTYAANFRERLLTASRKLEMWDVEATIISRDGKQKYTHAIARPHRQPDGSVLWNGLILDQTRIKTAELAAAAAEANTRHAIIESLSQGLVLFDAEDRLMICNSAYLKLYPLLQEIAVAGASYERIVSAELVEDVAPAGDADQRLRQRLDQHKLSHYNFERQLEDGRWVLVNERHTPDGGTIVLHSDISAVKQREVERSQLQEQFHRAQKLDAMGRLAGGIAHDFNNILASILGNANFLVQDLPAGSEVAEFADQITIAGKRAKDLVQQILAFSRQQPRGEEDVDAEAVVREVAELLRAAIPKSIELKVESLAAGATIRGNATEISQVMMNLCVNARDAIGNQHGSIELLIDMAPGEAAKRVGRVATTQAHTTAISTGSLDPKVRYLRIQVRDSGCGMDAEVLGRMFEPFFTTKEVGKGTGLGLAAVHGIVSSLKGIIACTSTLGHGTTFEVFLPAKAAAAAAFAGAAQQPDPRGKEAILVVDDEQQVAAMLARTLKRLGYAVDCFASATEALAAYRRTPGAWALAITDQTMPQMTGYELAEQILAHDAEFPMILCSGYSDAVTAGTAASVGIKAFLSKPVDQEVIARTVRELLDRSRKPAA
jgi:signal transduction histidine kinase/CheY-like chemotaxis protein